MGLFSKKDPCAICGGKVSGLFPWKMDDQYICNECHGVVDVQSDIESGFTLASFMAYRDFRAENQQLKSVFKVTDEIDMGLFDTKIVFDCQNRLFCFDKHLNKTIFTGDQLVSFTVKEDSVPLYEGSADGLVRHQSQVPERVMAMSERISQLRMQQEMRETMDRLRDKDGNSRPTNRLVDVPEPFKRFNVELKFKHPYWTLIKCDMDGPTFDMDTPDVYEYLREYRQNIEELEVLVKALMTIAFPTAAVRAPGEAAPAGAAKPAAAAQAAADPAAEIRKYMSLMKDGVITPAEFEAKKKQLLGL